LLSPNSKLLIDLKHKKLLVKKGGGVLIKKTATLRQVKTSDVVTNSAPTVAYILTDHLGSVAVSTNAQGAVTELSDYYPYGSIRVDEASTNSSSKEQRKYIGQEFDPSTSLSYLNARYYDGARGQFLSEDPVFWEVGQTQDGKNALTNPQALNSYSYAGNNPIINSDPQGRWYKEFLTGQQSWPSFQGELGEATNQLSQDSATWNFAFDHPYTTGAMVGVGSGAVASGVAYGATTAITQIAVGVNLARLSYAPMLSRVDTLPEKGFPAIRNATGLMKSEAIQVISSVGKSLVDMRPNNVGNINTLAQVGEKVIRITTNSSATLIKSAGVINGATKIAQYVATGAMRSLPVLTSVAKKMTQFITKLIK